MRLLLISLAFLWCTESVIADWDNQPKFVVRDGNLVMESAQDKDIMLRLKGSSTFLINDFDVVNELKKRDTEAVEERAAKVQELQDKVAQLNDSLVTFAQRFAVQMSNETASLMRLVSRSWRQNRRIAATLSYIKKNLITDDCQSSPCKNGGSCYDAYKAFKCTCAKGWEGPTCETDIDECAPMVQKDAGPCLNGASCINTPGSYRCICRDGYEGTHCSLREAVCGTASTEELCGHGTCIAENNNVGYKCLCDAGWTKANNTGPCVIDVDECAEQTNPCHSDCINLPGSYKCGACEAGFTGNGIVCRDINECADNNGGCSLRPLVRCINTVGSSHCDRCPIGWTGDGQTCEEASTNTCDKENICFPGGKCEYISEAVVCTCPPGMFGHGFGLEGCSTNKSFEPCRDHQCQNNGTCVVTGRGTACACPLGFAGPLCADADACQSSPCQNGGTCKVLPRSKFRCVCTKAYYGENCENLHFKMGDVLRNDSGTYQYPADGDLPATRSYWSIVTQPHKVINVTFNYLDFEEAPECENNFLQIHDGGNYGSPILGRFCGNKLPFNGNFVSSSNKLQFWYRSLNPKKYKGVSFSWIVQPYICGDVLELNSTAAGLISSPAYPRKTMPNRNCRWELNALFGQRFLIRFYDITLGNSSHNNCTGDKLILYDSDTVLFEACESSAPQPIYSSTNELKIDFNTDLKGTDSAFQLHYEVTAGTPDCGGIHTERSGIIRRLASSQLCIYLIQQPPGTQIRLEFVKFMLIPSATCDHDSLEIFDGRNDESPLMRKLCGVETELEPLVTKGNFAYLRYKNDFAKIIPNSAFEIRYEIACSQTLNDPNGGVFTTPLYPKPHLEHLICTYNIIGPVDSIVHINITDFSISDEVYRRSDTFGNISIIDREGKLYSSLKIQFSKNRKYQLLMSTTKSLVSINNQLRLTFYGASNPGRGRGLRVEYTFEKLSCGGVLSERSGNIYKVLIGDYCEWIIETAAETDQIHTEIYALENADVTFYDNSSNIGDAQVLYKISKSMQIMQNTFQTTLLTISMHRRQSYAPSIFSFKYSLLSVKQFCGGIFSTRTGTIKSPNWPKPYGPDQDCAWELRAPLGHQIELIVQNFTLETLTQDACNDDYLEIRNGGSISSPLIGRYCGTRIPPKIPSFGNRLYLFFHADAYRQDAGFLINWQQTATGCGGKLTSHVGSIHSPHRYNSEGAVVCSWEIVVSTGSKVDMEIRAGRELKELCNRELILADGMKGQEKTVFPNCTGVIDNEISLRFTSNRVMVFYTVREPSSKGVDFVIEYETNCNVILDKVSGVIESPNFPEHYPPNMNCTWDIRGGRNNRITLRFSHLAVEKLEAYDCDYDYVLVIDMRNEEKLSERRLCTNTEPITSVGNRLLVRFVSDSGTQAHGFHAEYRRIGCGEILTSNEGNFSSPNMPYAVDVDCDWYIDAPVGKQIQLIMHEIHIETDNSDCSEDLLLVAEQKNATTPLIRNCRVEPTELTVTSPQNYLHIYFRSSEKRKRKFFKASYSFVKATCGGVYSGSGDLYSPYYDERGFYVTQTECLWEIKATEGHGLLLQFKEFNFTKKNGCDNAFIELSKVEGDSKRVVHKLCEEGNREFLPFNSGDVQIRYKLQNYAYGRFLLHYQSTCGKLLQDSLGYIRADSSEFCIWRIKSNEGEKIKLDLINSDCHCHGTSSCTQGLKVHNIEDDTVLFDLCDGRHHVSNMILQSSDVRIVSNAVNFYAKYSTLQSSCGGTITSIQGALVSPSYPQTYPSNIECIWELRATPGSAIELKFEALDIAESPNCNEDFLEIRGNNETGSILALYCKNEAPSDSITWQQSVWLKFRSVPGSTGNGFKLNWNFVHNNELNETSGIIESPPVLSAAKQIEPYSWRITAERDFRIQLKFEIYNAGLELYDGYSEIAQPVPIENSPWEFTSATSVVFLKTLNSELEYFKLSWLSIHRDYVVGNDTEKRCSDFRTLSPNSRLIVTSPGYPVSYSPNLNCDWIFDLADKTYHVQILVMDVKLEVIDNCWADYLGVYSSSNLQDWNQELKLCNATNNGPNAVRIVQGTPYAKLHLKTDDTVSGTGFKAVVRPECGSNMTGPAGAILDVHMNPRVRTVTACVWRIDVHPGKIIDLNINYYSGGEVGSREVCPIYGLIYDGIDDHAPILRPGKFCNKAGQKHASFRSSTSHVVVKYVIEKAFLFHGLNKWNLTYREYSECDGDIVLTPFATTYNISSPNYPSVPNPHTICSWTVLAPPGETIVATFVDTFDMDTNRCDDEYVQIFDGSTELSRSLTRTCRRTDTIRSSSNTLHIRYQADTSVPRSGFRLNVSISTCGGTYTSNQGVITSEHFPVYGGYPKPAVCDYFIKLRTASQIEIKFDELDLPFNESSLNNADRLEIYSPELMQEPVRVIYGNETDLSSFNIEDSGVLIRFISVSVVNYHQGFNLTYRRLSGPKCSRNVVGSTGLLTVRADGATNWITRCTWRITVPKGKRVRLQFIDFPAFSSNITSLASWEFGGKSALARSQPLFRMYNDFQLGSKITEFDASAYNESEVIESTDNVMLVWLNPGQGFRTSYKVRYTSESNSPCPPNIGDRISGVISLSNLAGLKSYYCAIEFTVSPPETISFNVREYKVKRLAGSSLYLRDDVLNMPQLTVMKNLTNEVLSMSSRSGKLVILQNEMSKITHFDVSYKRHACGSMLQLEEGLEIEYPQIMFPINYGQLECVWTLKKSYNDAPFQLSGNVSFADDCSREYIAIYVGFRVFNSEVARICRDTDFRKVTLDKSYSTVIYHSENYRPAQSSFSIQMARLQNGTTYRISTRPSRPIVIDSKAYKNSMESTWEFLGTRGTYLSLSFQGRFFIEDSVNCTKDQLDVHYFKLGIWHHVGRFCGRKAPSVFNITTNRMRVIFRTNEAVTGDGFTFIVTPSCSIVLNATTQVGTLFSPPANRMRWQQMTCSYTFVSASDNAITVSMKQKPVQTTMRTCDVSNFKAFKKSGSEDEELIGQYCKDFEVHASRQLRIEYSSRYDYYFELEYKLDDCGGNISSPFELRPLRGEEQGAYALDMNCIWYVTAPEDHSIVLRFKYFDMEHTHDCRYDYLALYKGPVKAKEQQVAKLCGNMTDVPPLIAVDANQAVIEAVSDSSYSLKGFLASVHFTRSCNERLQLSNAEKSMLLQRTLNIAEREELLCYYHVSAPPSYRIVIRLSNLKLNFPKCAALNDTCRDCNYVEVKDSVMANAGSMGQYCDADDGQIELVSSYNDALLKFSGTKPGRVSFQLEFLLTPTICGETEFEIKPKEEKTLRFPLGGAKTYAPNTHCTWRFKTDSELEVDFNYAKLQEPAAETGKCVDYLLLRTSYVSKYFCGTFNNTQLMTSMLGNGNLDISFHSDQSREYKGFELKVKVASVCNRTYTKLSDLISNPIFTSEVSPCVCEIHVPADYYVNVYTTTLFGNNMDGDNDETYLKIKNINDGKLVFSTKEHGLEGFALHSSTNKLRIISSQISMLRLFYVATNKSLPLGCGGDINAPSGEFSNPPSYDARNSSDCRWTVAIPPGNKIRVSFSRFNMGSDINCNLNHLKFYEILPDNTQRLYIRLCGESVIDSFDLPTHRMLVVATKSPNFDGIGFALSFSMAIDFDFAQTKLPNEFN